MLLVVFPQDPFGHGERFVDSLQILRVVLPQPQEAVEVEAHTVGCLHRVADWLRELPLAHVGKYVPLRPVGKRIGEPSVDVLRFLVAFEHQVSVHAVGLLHAEEAVVDLVLQAHGLHHVGKLQQLDLRIRYAVHAVSEYVCQVPVRHLDELDAGVLRPDPSHPALYVLQTLHKVHEHAYDALKLRVDHVEQNEAVFAETTKEYAAV